MLYIRGLFPPVYQDTTGYSAYLERDQFRGYYREEEMDLWIFPLILNRESDS